MVKRWLLPVCLSVLVAALVLWRGAALLVDQAHVETALARQAVVKALKDADSTAAFAGRAQRQVLVLQSQRDSALMNAASHSRVAARLTSKLATLAAAAPDTCSPIIITADSALAEKDSVILADSVALVRSIASEQKLQVTVDTLGATLRRLSSASHDLVKADAHLSRRQLLLRFLPKPGIGVGMGLDATGSPHVITGLTLGWTL